jgi:hypothetical protein
MNAVFADSFYFFALLNEHDSAHDKAVAFTQEFRGRIVTTNAVLLEVGDGLANRSRRAVFQPLVASLQTNPRVSMLPCSPDLMRRDQFVCAADRQGLVAHRLRLIHRHAKRRNYRVADR